MNEVTILTKDDDFLKESAVDECVLYYLSVTYFQKSWRYKCCFSCVGELYAHHCR